MQEKIPRMEEQDVTKSQDGPNSKLSLPVRWAAPFFNSSGYASESINFVLPLADHVDLGIMHNSTLLSEEFINDLPPITRETLQRLQEHHKKINGGIFISHNPGFAFQRPDDAAYHIGRTMFETDRLPADWVHNCNQMDEIWVPSWFNAKSFARAGVERSKLKVIPGAVDSEFFDPENTQPLPLPNPASYNFLSVFEWSSRKGWDVLLAAYLREFSADDDVCLYLRTHLFGHPAQDASGILKHEIDEYTKTLKLGSKDLPRIELLTEQLPMSNLPGLYKAADCLVAPSRGEGWGRPQHEAMMMGLPVIATNWSGNTEFMTNNTAYLLDYELTETANLEPTQSHYQGHIWAEPFEEHLRQLMREVFVNPRESRLTGQRARAHVKKHFSRKTIAGLIINRLQVIEEKLTGIKPTTAPQPVENKKTEGKFIVAWEGSFLDYGSLSHVNRSITTELREQPGINLACIQKTVGMTPEMPDALTDFTQNMASEASTETQVTVRHSWPPIWEKPSHGKWVNIQPWEFGVLPAEWVREMEHLDEAWVPSSYVRNCYIDSGVPANKVQIIPNGIDEKIFRPDAPSLPIKTDKRYKFLFVGGTIGRKGPDILLNTYLETFTADDDVCLVIKDFGGKTFYAGQTLAQVIEKAQAQPNAPEIIYIDDDLPPEQVAGLYTACDCLVHPYRGEGFGLPVLEAMACGLPVICTGGGSTDDFATDAYAYRIPATRQATKPWIGQMLLVKEGWLLEPDPKALADRMRWVFKHRDKARAKGQRAAKHARTEWTWERAAQKAQARIHALSTQAQSANTIEGALDRMRATTDETADGDATPAIADLLIETTQNAMEHKNKTTDEDNVAKITQYLEKANLFLKSNSQHAAMDELEKARKLDSANPEVITMLGSLRYQAEEYAEAHELFRSLTKLRPTDSQAFTQMAMAAFQLERTEEFESSLGLALELDPTNIEALRFLARVNLQQKRFVDAAMAYRRIIELAPEDTASLLALAMCLYQGSEREAARLVYERVLEIEPENAIAKNNLAALTVGEEMASRNQPTQIDKAITAAQIAIEHNRLEEAGIILEETLNEMPDQPVLLEALANLYVTIENYERAKPIALRAAEVNEDNTLNWIRLGLIAYKQNDIDLFEHGLKKALALEPQNPEALRLLGHANLNVGNHAGAIRQYQQILEKYPEDTEVLQALGVCLHHLGEKDDAQAMFSKVLELEPQNLIANQNLAASQSDGITRMKARNGKSDCVDIASPTKTEADNVEPMPVSLKIPFQTRTEAKIYSDGKAHTLELPAITQLGNLDNAVKLAQAGKHNEAAKACVTAIELRPTHPDAWFYLAQIAIDAGDHHFARQAADRLLTISPNWDKALALENFLKEKAELITSDIEWPDLPSEIGKSRLTVCMIAKNEEDFIGQALASVKEIAHQIIVVDTGSTDRTVEIAREHGAEIYDFEWNDHFADARNHALQYARGDWVLILDADEELMVGTLEDLQNDLNIPNALGLRIPLINKQTASGGASHVPRLFRNAPGLCFLGRVHEQVFSSVISAANRWGMELGLGQATLLHHGYAPEVKTAKDKVARNLRLLEMALEEMPGEPALLMNYGLDLFNAGEVEKALEQLQRAAETMEQMNPGTLLPEVRERLVNTYASILMQAEENEVLINFAQSKLALASGPTATVHYLYGLALLKCNRSTEAITQLQACIDKADAPTLAPGCPGVNQAAPHHLIADCLTLDGRAEEAEEHYCQAVLKEPGNPGPRHDYARFLAAHNRAPEAIELLHEFLGEGTPNEHLWTLGCSIVTTYLADSQIADEWTETATLHYPENEDIIKHRAVALLTAGKFKEALELFEKEASSDDITTAAIYLCRLANGEADKLPVPENEIAVSKYLTDWYRRLLVHDNEVAADQVASRLDDMESLLPTAGKVLRQAIAA